MLYIILIGVIVFLAIKLGKPNKTNVPLEQIVDRAVKQIEDKLNLRTLPPVQQPRPEPVVVTPVTPVERVEPIVVVEESIEETIEEEILDDETDDPEVEAEADKKPLAEIIKKRIHHRKVLTLNEQPMFHRLKEALTEYSVLPQVSFNSLVWSRSKYIRNRFNRKVCDFAICDEVFKPIAVIELDDSSHNGREREDADRDCILNEAKIRVIRYKRVPEIEVIRKDLGLE